METIVESAEEKKVVPDDVDFQSGFETQYATEYRPLQPVQAQPPDPKLSWHRDFSTIAIIGFLLFIFLLGTILLITLVFTTNPWQILFITTAYIIVALIMIYVEVQSKYVR